MTMKPLPLGIAVGRNGLGDIMTLWDLLTEAVAESDITRMCSPFQVDLVLTVLKRRPVHIENQPTAMVWYNVDSDELNALVRILFYATRHWDCWPDQLHWLKDQGGWPDFLRQAWEA
jgi:hypothetical protein